MSILSWCLFIFILLSTFPVYKNFFSYVEVTGILMIIGNHGTATRSFLKVRGTIWVKLLPQEEKAMVPHSSSHFRTCSSRHLPSLTCAIQSLDPNSPPYPLELSVAYCFASKVNFTALLSSLYALPDICYIKASKFWLWIRITWTF